MALVMGGSLLAEAEVRAPDLIEPLVGWKALVVVGQGGSARLSSPSYPTSWPLRGPLTATCAIIADRKGVVFGGPEHQVPCERCSCGIYAVGDVREALVYLQPSGVLVKVKLWGKVIPGVKGWRAQYARPLELVDGFGPPDTSLLYLADLYELALVEGPPPTTLADVVAALEQDRRMAIRLWEEVQRLPVDGVVQLSANGKRVLTVTRLALEDAFRSLSWWPQLEEQQWLHRRPPSTFLDWLRHG